MKNCCENCDCASKKEVGDFVKEILMLIAKVLCFPLLGLWYLLLILGVLLMSGLQYIYPEL